MREVTRISTIHLTKRYDGSTNDALQKLTLSVNSGEVYGFLGPNGAGKSTTIKLLMGLLKPTSGSAAINGYDVWCDGVIARYSVGYLAGDFNGYPQMTGQEVLTFLSDISGQNNSKYVLNLAKQLGADLSKRLYELSKGNRQKIGLIQALMHKPDVIILDEPTTGLDPLVQETFYELIAESRARGAAVFMSSHNLLEVQKVCDRVGIIKQGRLIRESALAELKTVASQTFDIVFRSKPPLSALQKLAKAPLIVEGNRVSLQIESDLSALFRLLAESSVVHLTTRELDLEDTFMQFYEEK